MEQKREGSDELAREAVEMIRFDLRRKLSSVLLQFLETRKSLGTSVPSTVLCEQWGQMLDMLAGILRQHYPAFVNIASHDPGCTNPPDWALKKCREVVNDVMSRKIVLDDETMEIIKRPLMDIVVDAYYNNDEETTHAEMLTDLYVEIENVMAQARDESTLALAQSGWKPKVKLTEERKSEITTSESKQVQFEEAGTTLRLVDLQDDRSRPRKVREFYPHLKQAVADVRRYLDKEKKSNNKVTVLDVEEHFPLLQGIDPIEYQFIGGRLSLRMAAISVLSRRTGLPDETIQKYIRSKTQS
jgi:hypothetical protein